MKVEELKKKADDLDIIYGSYYLDENNYTYYMKKSFKYSTVVTFIQKLGYDEVEKSLHYAFSKIGHHEHHTERVLKYFCGICWGKINARLLDED